MIRYVSETSGLKVYVFLIFGLDYSHYLAQNHSTVSRMQSKRDADWGDIGDRNSNLRTCGSRCVEHGGIVITRSRRGFQAKNRVFVFPVKDRIWQFCTVHRVRLVVARVLTRFA